MYRRLGVYWLVLLAVVTGSSFVAFLLSNLFQRLVAQPILELANMARQVSENRDYSMRAVKLSGDELGILTDSFNQMLGDIEERMAGVVTTSEGLANDARSADFGDLHRKTDALRQQLLAARNRIGLLKEALVKAVPRTLFS